MRALLIVPFFAACGSSVPDDVIGPFPGQAHRYAIDRFILPSSGDSSYRTLGADLDGDGVIDNALGAGIANLAGFGNAPMHPEDLIADGLVQSAIEIYEGSPAGVAYVGVPGTPGVAVGGVLANGGFRSNRTATGEHLLEASLVLPAFIDADPATFALVDGQIDLSPDGAGGYDGVVRGLVDPAAATMEAARLILQMANQAPHDHRGLEAIFDTDRDGEITIAEVLANATFRASLTPDIQRGDALWFSIGFGFHAIPCEAGSCISTAVVDACHDRILDGDEVDVDCGGACGACGAAASCTVDTDCDSRRCEAGHCRPATCSDGLVNGYENGVDCGTLVCGGCTGDSCSTAAECESGNCLNDLCE